MTAVVLDDINASTDAARPDRRPAGLLGRVHVSLIQTKNEARDVYVPLKMANCIINPHIKADSAIMDYAKARTRRGKDISALKLRNCPWRDPGYPKLHDAGTAQTSLSFLEVAPDSTSSWHAGPDADAARRFGGEDTAFDCPGRFFGACVQDNRFSFAT